MRLHVCEWESVYVCVRAPALITQFPTIPGSKCYKWHHVSMAKCWAHLQDKPEQNLGLDNKPCPRNPFSKTTLKSLLWILTPSASRVTSCPMIYSPSLLHKVVRESLHYLRWTQSISPECFWLSEVWNLQNKVRDLKLQHLMENFNKPTTSTRFNTYLTCHRTLSCQSSLKMHYPTHIREKASRYKSWGCWGWRMAKSLRPGLHDEFYISQDYSVR